MSDKSKTAMSVTRIRIGIVLFALWWIPVYLLVPTILTAIGQGSNKKAVTITTLVVVLIQTVIGFLGLFMAGKELTTTLGKVRTSKLPITVWNIFWHGDSYVNPAYLKTVKPKVKPVAAESKSEKSDINVDLITLVKSKDYARLLVLAAIIGVPISAISYFFLYFINHLENWLYVKLPLNIGFSVTPRWWPFLPLIIASLIVGIVIKYLPGKGGHVPADGFKAGGYPLPVELIGIIIAAIASIGFGAVVGPEAPLIAIGGGLGYIAIRLMKKDVPSKTAAVVAATGSFAAISTLLGSPLLGAFLLMEASGLGGDKATAALVPGLLGAGIGSLIFTGIGSLTGLGTQSLVIPNLPTFTHITIGLFGWALAIGVIAAILGTIIKRIGPLVADRVTKHTIQTVLISGLLIAALAVIYSLITGHNSTDVLFSGQSALPYFISHASSFSLAAIIILFLTKGIAYSLSLGSFRGGPVFPSMFLGTLIGIALSHFSGLPEVPAIAMGIGAMAVTMLRLPFTSVLLATLLLLSSGVTLMPLVIVAVVVAFVISTKLLPKPINT